MELYGIKLPHNLLLEKALHHFDRLLKGKIVLVKSDNTTAAYYVNKEEGENLWL